MWDDETWVYFFRIMFLLGIRHYCSCHSKTCWYLKFHWEDGTYLCVMNPFYDGSHAIHTGLNRRNELKCPDRHSGLNMYTTIRFFSWETKQKIHCCWPMMSVTLRDQSGCCHIKHICPRWKWKSLSFFMFTYTLKTILPTYTT